MLWWTASRWTGHSKRELVQYKLESEREENPNSKKAGMTPVPYWSWLFGEF